MTIGMPAMAPTIFSANFSNRTFGGFTPVGPVDITTARPGYVACCGATGSEAALTNSLATFGSGHRKHGVDLDHVRDGAGQGL